MNVDEYWMQKALDCAQIAGGQTSPNPLVGAVVVRDGWVVGQGAHLRAGGPHAEVHALRMAGELAKGATIYVTLEPCHHFGRTPPCTEAIVAAGIRKVVVAVADRDPRTANLGVAFLREAGIEVEIGVLREEAKRINRAFFHRVDTGRPLIVYKSAMTLSGHVAASNGRSQYVTGADARADVQRLRQAHPGIAVGVQTVIADDPSLTVRDAGQGDDIVRQPTRIIFDSHLRMPVNARLLRLPGKTVVITTDAAFEREQFAKTFDLAADSDNFAMIPVPELNGRIDLDAACQMLASREGLNSVLLEGGPTLAAAFFERRLVDEARIYLAPKLLTHGLVQLAGAGTSDMSDAIELVDARVTEVGEDFRIDANVKYR